MVTGLTNAQSADALDSLKFEVIVVVHIDANKKDCDIMVYLCGLLTDASDRPCSTFITLVLNPHLHHQLPYLC